MAAFKQFEALIQWGQSQTWFVWGFPRNVFVEWMARPVALPDVLGFGIRSRVSIEKVIIEAAPDGTFTHFITIHGDLTNIIPEVGSDAVSFLFEVFQNQTTL